MRCWGGRNGTEEEQQQPQGEQRTNRRWRAAREGVRVERVLVLVVGLLATRANKASKRAG